MPINKCYITSVATQYHKMPTLCFKTNSQNCFWHNFVKFPPTLIIFDKKMTKMILLCTMHSFTTSPNLYQCTTVWITDDPKCYITWRLFVSDGSTLHHQFDKGWTWFNNFEVLNILWWKQHTTKAVFWMA